MTIVMGSFYYIGKIFYIDMMLSSDTEFSTYKGFTTLGLLRLSRTGMARANARVP